MFAILGVKKMKPTHSSFTLLALHHGTRAGRRVDYFSINTLLLFFVVFFFFLQFGFYLHTKNEKGDITCESASCRKGVVYNWSELAFPPATSVSLIYILLLSLYLNLNNLEYI